MRTSRFIIFPLLIAALIGLSALPQSGNAAPLYNFPGNANLIACWDMNETSGTRNDSHGSNHLTDNNTVGYTTGIYSNAASFVSANSEYLSINDNATLSMGDVDFSVVFWVNLTSKITQIITVKGPPGDFTLREFSVGYNSSPINRFTLRVGNGASSQAINADSFGEPNISTWYFIAVVHNAAANTISIQVNNTSPNSASYSGGSYDSAYPLTIGGLSDGTLSMSGLLDEFAIYKKALSSDEITWLFNSGIGRSCGALQPTATPTPTPTATFTSSPTFTLTPSNTPTFTPSPTFTFTPSNTPTNTATRTPTPSNTPTHTATFTPSHTPETPSDTPTPSNTPTETPTPTETATPTATFTPTVTYTPSPTRTPGNMATAFYDGIITYGDAANVTVTSLLCLVVVIGLLIYLTSTYLQRRRK